MVKIKTPGKLYIAGEYAVVNPGHSAIVIAVDRFIRLELTNSDIGVIDSKGYPISEWYRDDNKILLKENQGKFRFLLSAIEVVERYLKELDIELEYFKISIESELVNQDGVKYGLGSSAAVAICLINAMLTYYGVNFTKLELFKLAAMATILVSPNTSCGDLASASFGGVIKYTSFCRSEIIEKYNKESIKEIINSDWKHLNIEQIDMDENVKVLVGWTETPASTEKLVSDSLGKDDESFMEKFLFDSEECVDTLAQALESGDFEKIKLAIKKNRELLLKYELNKQVKIETDKLKNLIEIAEKNGLASKTSGAGGGDCGIAIGMMDYNFENVINDWKKLDIVNLNLEIFEENNE